MPRPKIHDDALRTTLIDAAGAKITAEGYSALSLRRLAADVGTSTTAVYSLFGGKPGLLRELYREAFRRFGEHLNQVRPSDDPVDDIVRLGHAYRASALDDPHLYAVMFGPRHPSQEPDEQGAAEAAETFVPLLDAVRRAVDSGAFRPLDPALIATALWAGVHGLVSLELGQFLPPQAGAPADVFSTAIRAGVDAWRT
ncbi:MAG: TetR/AcrR family transcriptional regulator [Actinomycetota bacterium]|nr:TetR/AcrR family transcriptional regulator [Actinomycetota bacterium]